MTTRKKFIIGVVVIFLVAVIGIVYAYKSRLTSPTSNLAISPPPKTNSEIPSEFKTGILPPPTIADYTSKETTTLADIFQKNLAWIDKAQTNNGMFPLTLTCTAGDKRCVPSSPDNQVGITVLWAHYQKYLFTKNPDDKKTVENRIALYSGKILQPDYWNCKLLYPIFLDSTISQVTKNTVKSLCQTAGWLNYGIASTQHKDINSFDWGTAFTSNNELGVPEALLPTSDKEFEMYAMYASDFATSYMWLNTASSLEISKSYFDAALTYADRKQFQYIPNIAVLGIAALDMYNATMNPVYLDFGKKLYETYAYAKTPEVSTDLYLGILSNELYKTTKEAKYGDQSKTYFANLLENGLDSKAYKGYQMDSYGFHAYNGDSNIYNIRFNAMINSLFWNGTIK